MGNVVCRKKKKKKEKKSQVTHTRVASKGSYGTDPIWAESKRSNGRETAQTISLGMKCLGFGLENDFARVYL
jgi:hypothetical protein